MSAQIIPFPRRDGLSFTTSLPFSAFQDAPEMRAAGLTPGDLHDAARGLGSVGLKSWPMRQGGRLVRHTSLHYVREHIAARREEVSEWARRMAAAPIEVQEIERLIT